MAYEVWMFEHETTEEGETGKPSKLVSVATCPVDYGYADADRWAAHQREIYATMGADVTTVIRREASY